MRHGVVLLALGAMTAGPCLAQSSARDRISILEPRPPEQLSVLVDVSLASMLPGAETLLAKKRGQSLEAALRKEGFDLADTLALQVSAALADEGLRRVALGVKPPSRSKSEGWASAPSGDCGCDFWLDLIVDEAGFRADSSLGSLQPTLTVRVGLIGALRRARIASKTLQLRPEKGLSVVPRATESPVVASRPGQGAKSVDALLADGKGAARDLRNAIADMATAIAREAARAAGVRARVEPGDDGHVPPPPVEIDAGAAS